MSTLPPAIPKAETGAKTLTETLRDIFHPDSAVAIVSRGIATIGGGIALGWMTAKLTGSIIGGTVGLLAIFLSEKRR